MSKLERSGSEGAASRQSRHGAVPCSSGTGYGKLNKDPVAGITGVMGNYYCRQSEPVSDPSIVQ